MTSIQPLQQKSRDYARADFERGFKEFMHGHVDDCISFRYVHNQEDEDDEDDQLVRRRRISSQIEGSGDDYNHQEKKL
ncbi:unnamed protein product [Eruca vesicaria subsp. sativa]|uniref:Uncharacterized protein n=1 Tax=Eruca vesicaria subsp. sativa TaxID=29727 RepID=A0ABC8ITU2_ERUVS|nr:unnamed protein product [Eruca vesicaria subsp. sativa]